MDFQDYQPGAYFDELFLAAQMPRAGMSPLINQINDLSKCALSRHQQAAEHALFQLGITFAVKDHHDQTEKIFPFDIIPRIIQAKEWQKIEQGLQQRVQALNCFIDDIYQQQRILKDKIIPTELVKSTPNFRAACMGLKPPQNNWIPISGIDLVRDDHGEFYVLEDNLRCPSGIAYVLENRGILKRTFARAFKTMRVRPVADYCDHLYETLCDIAPTQQNDPNVVLLTPGQYNSAYYEHAYLAQHMGVRLVEGRDLCVVNDQVMIKTTKGLERVDIIYSRIDDDYLDPEVFKADSLLGVAGLMRCYQKGTVAIANAPGTGIADDKAIYAYIPAMIRYYLDQDPIIHNVPTYVCLDKKQCQYVIEHIDELVVKCTNQSGGYGMIIGNSASHDEKQAMIASIKQNPRNYIAQPILNLSRAPTIVGNRIQGRHVDLRPFILKKKQSTYVLPGGLTRVALVEDSLVVNSSQGGGSKDTWVLSE